MSVRVCPHCFSPIADESRLEMDNDRLRELVRELHSLYVQAIDDCESMDEANIWEYSDSIYEDLVQSKTVFDDLRHKFDDAMREMGIEVKP